MTDKAGDNGRQQKPPSHKSVGEHIRQARETAGIHPDQIWNDTRISPQMLEALESGRYSELPAPPYVRAFLQTLARYLGLDAKALLDLHARESNASAQPRRVRREESAEPESAPSLNPLLILPIVLILGILFFVIVQLNQGGGSAPAATPPRPVADAPIDTSEAFPPPIDTLGAGADTAGADTASEAAPASPEAPGTEAAPETLPAETVENPPEAVVPTARNPTDGITRLTLTSLVDSVWIRVLRPGKDEFNKLLKKEQSVLFLHRDTIFVTAGIAQAVEARSGGVSVVPPEKNFKVYRNQVIP